MPVFFPPACAAYQRVWFRAVQRWCGHLHRHQRMWWLKLRHFLLHEMRVFKSIFCPQLFWNCRHNCGFCTVFFFLPLAVMFSWAARCFQPNCLIVLLTERQLSVLYFSPLEYRMTLIVVSVFARAAESVNVTVSLSRFCVCVCAHMCTPAAVYLCVCVCFLSMPFPKVGWLWNCMLDCLAY